MSARSLKTIAWAVSPILIGLALVGVIFITDFKGSTVVTRIKIETLIFICAALLSMLILSLTYLYSKAERTRLTVEKEQHKKNRDEHKRFIQRLDHELKNPLTAIQLGLENLQHDQPINSVNNPIAELQKQTRRLTQLTGDLRKLASFDEQALELKKINIADFLNETKKLVTELGSEREVQLILPAAPWPVPNVLGDRDLLQLAIYNIIENAIKYSDQNDRIEVRASDNSKWVKIEVSDTGIGIAQGDVEKVWEELYRGDNGRHRNGTGIGLSLVKRIIERHSGEFQIESKENMGTRVTVSLPISLSL